MGKGDSRTKKGKRFMRSPRKYSQKKQLNTGKMENKSEYGIYEEFLKNFDSVNYKNKDSSTINNEFQKVISELCEKDMINVALQAELDRQVFLIRKSFEFQDDETKGTIKGLSWQMAGTQDMANGNKIPFYWPDVRNLTKENFEFFEQRYKKTNNLYAKTEYGLMVYFGQKTDWSKNNSFKLQLCNELISLAQEYYGEAQKGEYFKLGYVLNRLELALQIAINSKFEDCQKAIIEQVFDIQQHWSVNDNTKHVPLNYSRFMLEHYSICKKYIDFEKVIERNKYAISLIEKDNLYMAADAIEFTDKLKQKINLSIEDSLKQRAEVYEQIAKSRQEDIASMHFIKLALDIYLKIKDNGKIKEMEEFFFVYEPCPMEVVYNPDQPYEFVKLYLGTYFPRSFAEAYSIISSLMTNDKYKQSLYNLQEINVLDFCCGTGGEIVGLLVALSDNLPNLKRVNINAYDANPDAILFLYHLTELMEKAPEFRLEIHINPQCIYIESELEIQDVINMSNAQYHFIMSFKAINEFVQRGTFNKSNPYELIVSYFSPLLKANGVFIISDVTTKVDNGLYYPQMMNSGINRFLKNSQQYKSIVPNACYHLENQCSGCYMQDIFHVSHRGKNSDRSKIAYRIICNKSFAQEVMAGYTLKTCRAINPLADKNIPYDLWH